MLIDDLNHTIDGWIKGLDQYNFIQLCTKPSPECWSVGQLYMHLVEDSTYYLEQIRSCVSHNDHSFEEAAPFAKTLFLNNGFPDELIEGAPSHASIPQPDSKAQVVALLVNLKEEFNKAEQLITDSAFKGKAKHPGLHYFNAREWMQFAEMHFRHHLRQKKRIGEYLDK